MSHTAPDRRHIPKCRVLLTCLPLLFGTGGCAALTLDTLGSVLGFAGTAAQAGADVYHFGKLDFSVMATFEDARAAALAAVSDLQLNLDKIEFTDKKNDEVVYKLHDRKRDMKIEIDRRTDMLCQCRVNVGIFGSEPTAKLIMERMRIYLGRGKVAGPPPGKNGAAP